MYTDEPTSVGKLLNLSVRFISTGSFTLRINATLVSSVVRYRYCISVFQYIYIDSTISVVMILFILFYYFLNETVN